MLNKIIMTLECLVSNPLRKLMLGDYKPDIVPNSAPQLAAPFLSHPLSQAGARHAPWLRHAYHAVTAPPRLVQVLHTKYSP